MDQDPLDVEKTFKFITTLLAPPSDAEAALPVKAAAIIAPPVCVTALEKKISPGLVGFVAATSSPLA